MERPGLPSKRDPKAALAQRLRPSLCTIGPVVSVNILEQPLWFARSVVKEACHAIGFALVAFNRVLDDL